jgi:hypothetical protein
MEQGRCHRQLPRSDGERNNWTTISLTLNELKKNGTEGAETVKEQKRLQEELKKLERQQRKQRQEIFTV